VDTSLTETTSTWRAGGPEDRWLGKGPNRKKREAEKEVVSGRYFFIAVEVMRK